MNLNWMGEAQKLIAITTHIFKHYGRIFCGLNDETRAFFTKLYLDLEARKHPVDASAGTPPPSPIPPPRGLGTIKASALASECGGLFEVKICNDVKSVLDSEFGLDAAMLSTREQVVMNSLVRLRNPKAIFEFGTCRGATTYNFYSNSSAHCKIYTIDVWSHHDRLAVVEQAFQDSRMERLLGDTRNFDFSAFHDSMDFIFIDGGHDYETVKSDTANALRMCRKGGLILWHDYCEDHPGVMNCLHELSERYEVCKIESTTLGALLV